jgi:alkylation response protein AidB-like acyl-CoA dehydrogenase
MDRNLYTAEHEAFREVVRTFVEREVSPNLDRWETERIIGRETWLAAGRQGLVGLSGPEEFGGGGQSDYRFRNVIHEELARVCAGSLMSSLSLQDDIVLPYLVALADAEQRQRWLPGMCSGELIGAIAMTEPGTGSDLRGIRTRAEAAPGGWLLNGNKTFITSGYQADLVIVVARTDAAGGRNGFTFLVVESGTPGFTRGRKLDKIGLAAQDTAELSFVDVFVPAENTLGDVGQAFGQLMHHLPLERLSIAATAIAAADAALAWTLDYVRERTAFGQRIADFQNTQFVLAEVATELDVTRSFIDRAVLAVGDGMLSAVEAAQAKWWATEVQGRAIDRLLQLYGGYGYMREYPIARAYEDARVQRIYGGTSEIMKHIIARDLV